MTIRQRILVGYLIVIVCLGAVALGGVLWTDAEIARSTSVARLAQGIHLELLEARRREKDYLLRHDLEHIEGTGQEEGSVREHLAQARVLLKEWTEVSAVPIQEVVRQDLDTYEAHLMRLVQALEKRGHGDRGLIGVWRLKVHALEAALKGLSDQYPTLLLLQMRRHEKDYLLRADPSYAVQTRELSRELDRYLTEHATLVPDVKATQALLVEYTELFLRVTEIDQQNVLHQEQFRQAAHDVEARMGKTATDAWLLAAAERQKLRSFLLVIGLFVVAVTLAVSFLNARAIARPIHAVVVVAAKLAKGDFQDRVRVKAGGELGTLIESTNRMADDLQTAFGKLEEWNQKLQDRVSTEVARVEKARSLQRFMPSNLVEQILDREDGFVARHDRRKVTVFFSDLSGFTKFTDQSEPELVSGLLNEYLSAMSEIAFRYGGTIDKFIGDGIMIFFGAPDSLGELEDARRCVAMSIVMQEAVRGLEKIWSARGHDVQFGVRIGINTGFVTVGHFGSDHRMEYTAVGGSVNLASRIEGASAINAITLSRSTYLLVKDHFSISPRGEVTLKGIQQPQQIYEVQSHAQPTATPA